MQMSGEQRIAAPRDRVWTALNDPEVLRRCIPGCHSLDKESDTAMRAVVEIKIGPIGARFNGAVTLSDIEPPESYTITGQGQGGTVGSAKGGAKVRLADQGDATLLTYDVDAEVGGRLAQLGGPIIDATAKQLAAKFFRQFAAEVEAPAAAAPAQAAAPQAVAGEAAMVSAPMASTPPTLTPAPSPAERRGVLWGWVLAVVLALVTGFYMGLLQLGGAFLLFTAVLVIVVAAVAFEAGRRGGRSS